MFESDFFFFKLLQILVYFCFFLQMYEKTIFSIKDLQNSFPSETKVSGWFINLLMLVYTLPSEYESAIFYVSRGSLGILGLLFCQTY